MRVYVTDNGGVIEDIMRFGTIFNGPGRGLKPEVSERIEVAIRSGRDVVITKDDKLKVILLQREIPESEVNAGACGNCGSKDFRTGQDYYICNTCGCGGGI